MYKICILPLKPNLYNDYLERLFVLQYTQKNMELQLRIPNMGELISPQHTTQFKHWHIHGY